MGTIKEEKPKDNGWDIEPVVEESNDDGNDGWDNDEDWGSLEEVTEEKGQDTSKSFSYDRGQPAKSLHDPFADLGDTRSRGGAGERSSRSSEVASFNVASSWDDWGDQGPKTGGSSGEDAKKKREER